MADHGVLQRDAVASEDRAALPSDGQRLAGVVELAEADLLWRDDVLVLESAQMDREEHALAELEGHVGQLLLRHLVAGDGLVELLAIDGVAQGGLEAVARGAQSAVGDAEPSLIEAGQGSLEPPDAGQHRRCGQADIVEDQLGGHGGPQRHLLVDLPRREAGRVSRDDESANPVIGLRPHDRDVCDRAVGDPHLRAVEHPVVGVALGSRAHAGRIGAEVGLGEAEAADGLALGHARKPLFLLLLGAEGVNGVHRERALHAHE